jgi:hypothetical protein
MKQMIKISSNKRASKKTHQYDIKQKKNIYLTIVAVCETVGKLLEEEIRRMLSAHHPLAHR